MVATLLPIPPAFPHMHAASPAPGAAAQTWLEGSARPESKDALYPDLYVYFDAADTTSPVNVAATKVGVVLAGGRALTCRAAAVGRQADGCAADSVAVP